MSQLKLKADVELTPWGPGNGKITSETKLNEAQLEYLAERYPEAFEGAEAGDAKTAKKGKAKAEPSEQ